MSLTVYGTPMSRAARPLWMCRELGIEFEHVPTGFADGGVKRPDFLALNPNGRIPALRDGDFTLWESMAINLYLARKHESDLSPRGLEEEALAWQWSFWVMTEVEKPLLGVLLQRIRLPEGSPEARYFEEHVPKDPAMEKEGLAALEAPLGVLDRHLDGRAHLVADRFTVADLNVASVLAWAQMAQIDLSSMPNVATWLGRCLSRPAFSG